MYVIIVYDIEEDRVDRVNKILKRFLNWRQNSVFEGELTNSQLEELNQEIALVIDPSEDSVLIYKLANKNDFETMILGKDKSPIDRIL